jgi:hypothetical protein
MKKYLAYNAQLLAFEQSLVKLQNGDILEDNDVTQLKNFEIVNESPVIPCVVDDFVTQAFKKSRLSRSECVHNEKYIDTSFIPPTSNICERLFSNSKLVYSDLRKSLLPDTLELILFLKVNGHMWDETFVAKALNEG